MNPVNYAKKWLSRRRTLSILSELDDHELSDIGLNRYDVRRRSAHSLR